MVVSCVAYGCKEKFRKGSGISFHRFPVDVQIRKQWVVALRRKNFYPSEHSRVCSKHFSLDSFNKEAFGIGAILKRNAVPTIFNFPSYLLPPTSKKRKSPAKRKVHEESVSLSSFITEDKAHPKRGKHKRTAFNEIKTTSIRCNNSCEMDTKLELKEEDALSDIASQNEREFFPKDAVMKSNCDDVLLGDDHDVVIKTEIKSEVPTP